MRIQLSDHFTYPKLLRFVLPSITMMIFTSIYGVVDGLFVSNYVGTTAFAAINLIIPYLMILGAVGFMFGTGGSAIVAKTLGEGDNDKANAYFSMIIFTAILLSILLTFIGFFTIRPLSILLGADESMLKICTLYGSILLCSLTGYILLNVFQSFLVTAEKPKLGLTITVLAGVANMVLDFLLIAVFKWGIVGAAVATAISQSIGGFLPLIYFIKKNDSLLQIQKTKFYRKILLKTCTNGSSEFMSNLSLSLVSILYNFQLMRFAGQNGIAAYGVIMYIYYIFAALFLGFSIGSAPVFGYHYGAGNKAELKNLFQKSLVLITIWNVLLTVISIAFSKPLSGIFVGYDKELLALTSRGFTLYSLSFLFAGFNIFVSSLFTSLNNGVISATLSFVRTLVFQVLALYILPLLFGIDGIWLAIVVAEFLSVLLATFLVWKKRKTYQYF